ncbi:MAG: hypothetical protein V1831_03270 [Candidatus Woesearchaeota archaeon]
MAKKRGVKVKKAAAVSKVKNIVPAVVNAEKAVAAKVTEIPKKVSGISFFSKIFHKHEPKTEYRKKEEKDLKDVEDGLSSLSQKTENAPAWFYISSIFAVYLFTIFISIYATIHFEDISYMNMTVVFLFISMVFFFLISAVFLLSEKKRLYAFTLILFFAGLVAIMIYAFKATDTSDLVKYSIWYTIIVSTISVYILAIRK